MGPNTVTVLFGRINNNFTLEECDLHEVNSIENNCVMEDPWLYLKDTVCIVRKDNSPADFYEMISPSKTGGVCHRIPGRHFQILKDTRRSSSLYSKSV